MGAGNTPVFFFNNNQVNSGAATNQELAVWAQITLRDSSDATHVAYFDLTNRGYSFTDPGGGIFSSVNPTAYLSYTNTTGAGPLAGTNSATDYVLSGGQLCVEPTPPLQFPSKYTTDPCVGTEVTVNTNLGANQAAFAVVVPELNTILTSPNFGGYDSLSLDLRMRLRPEYGWLQHERYAGRRD